ncbi:hypothetical protein IVA96_20950 [Bradyrhizobium sp. 159]|uniref:O-antigen ligase family protein n=1 Tax=Bradyrhizobium sp. 159 TaxID=2782632 RepID=UPI001FFA1470|nr:hypothetical protein [Bradyrhizobium sp. 159]MCK1619037.1 hypothetical protein [Bradyrhizobium sp. 159]
MPPTMAFSLAEFRLLPGRVSIFVLLGPAIFILMRRSPRMLGSDALMIAVGAWLIAASMYVEGFSSISSAVIETIEFCGAYLIGRAFVYGLSGLMEFIRVFKLVTIGLILLAMIDTLSGRHLVMEITGGIFGVQLSNAFMEPRSLFGLTLIRAQSTFDHPILYGTFCALAAPIFLYAESGLRRILYYGLCSFGCLLAASSAPLMSLAIATVIFVYDRILLQYSWRWKLFWSVVSGLVGLSFLIANYPISWIISHLTFDPASGYYRIMIWELASAQISASPITGYGFTAFNDPVLDTSVDSVWLVGALRFGVPMIALLFLANVAACVRALPKGALDAADPYMINMRTAFSVVVMMFMFNGLTVHFWNGSWMFWGLCLGIRGSLNEYFEAAAEQAQRYAQSWVARSVAFSGAQAAAVSAVGDLSSPLISEGGG